MYKYNYFCFLAGVAGALIAFIALGDINYTILSLVLAMFNYYLYHTGKQNA